MVRLKRLRLLYAWAQFSSLCFMTNKVFFFFEWQEKNSYFQVISRVKNISL